MTTHELLSLPDCTKQDFTRQTMYWSVRKQEETTIKAVMSFIRHNHVWWR